MQVHIHIDRQTNFEALPSFPCLGKYKKSSDENTETCI